MVHSKHGVVPGNITLAWPLKPSVPPSTIGLTVISTGLPSESYSIFTRNSYRKVNQGRKQFYWSFNRKATTHKHSKWKNQIGEHTDEYEIWPKIHIKDSTFSRRKGVNWHHHLKEDKSWVFHPSKKEKARTKETASHSIYIASSLNGIKTKNNDIEVTIEVKFFVFYTTKMRYDIYTTNSLCYSLGCHLCFWLTNIFKSVLVIKSIKNWSKSSAKMLKLKKKKKKKKTIMTIPHSTSKIQTISKIYQALTL